MDRVREGLVVRVAVKAGVKASKAIVTGKTLAVTVRAKQKVKLRFEVLSGKKVSRRAGCR